MIEFQALIRAIHRSVKDAAKSVETETTDFIERFFEEAPKEVQALTESSVDGDAEVSRHDTPILRPKTCAIQFPSRTATGVDMVTAEVPIVTLVPISAPRIKEVKFSTELEIHTNKKDQLLVSFPEPKKRSWFHSEDDEGMKSLGNTKIEITLTGDEPPEGLKKIIEGYERALRAQIPG